MTPPATPDQILDQLRAAHADAVAAELAARTLAGRYSAAIAALEVADEPAAAPSSTTRPRRSTTRPTSAASTGKGYDRTCSHCGETVDARYLSRHEAKCPAAPATSSGPTRAAAPTPPAIGGTYRCCTPGCDDAYPTLVDLSLHVGDAHDRDLLLPERRPAEAAS